MKSVLSGIGSFSKLLLTGLNPHIQEIVSLLFTMILNKRKNLSCVFLLLRGHNFLSVKGCNRWGWVKARSKPLVTSMTKETNFLFFPNRQSAYPFVKSSAHFGNQVFKVFAWQAFACLVLNREVTHLFHFFPFRTVLSTKTLISYSSDFKKIVFLVIYDHAAKFAPWFLELNRRARTRWC